MKNFNLNNMDSIDEELPGHVKFWSIIFFVFYIFSGYIYFTRDLTSTFTFKSFILFVSNFIFFATSIILICFLINLFFTELLPRLNDWLDEKF